MTLTNTQKTIVNIIHEDGPIKSSEIADTMGYSSPSTVRDHFAEIRNQGYELVHDGDYNYREVINNNTETEEPTNTYRQSRQTRASKQTITKKANDFLAELEKLKPAVEAFEPPNAELVQNDGNVDLVVHITDVHFGEVRSDKNNEVIVDSPVIGQRVKKVFRETEQYKLDLQAQGIDVDTVHVLLGGDIVTNEAIFKGQPWHVDSTIKEQMANALAVLDPEISRLARSFPSVQVVCQHGNHGEFRVGDGGSDEANADDFIYFFLDYTFRKSELDNIRMVKDERNYFTNFKMRGGKWNGHLRHGNKTLGHIGTSSPQSDWSAWENDHDFDAAFYGHHHELREEPTPNGALTFMGGNFVGSGDFAESLGKFGPARSHILEVGDEQFLRNKRYVNFNGSK